MFIDQRFVEESLRALETVHPFYGITFLVCKKGELPVGKTIPFRINHKEDEFLREYYRPDPRTVWFYRAFRVSDKRKYWLRPDYAWKGSQAVRTRTFGRAFLHDRSSDQWGWVQHYIEVLKNPQYLPEKLPAFAFAVWLFRNRGWPINASAPDVLQRFLDEFHIDLSEQQQLFDLSIPSMTTGFLLAEQPYSWQIASQHLGIPAPEGFPRDEGGTLSALKIEAIGPAKKLHLELADRMNLITGDNGLGKSFILDCAWWALSGIWSGFPAYPREDAKRTEPRISYRIQGTTGQTESGESVYDWDTHDWWSSNPERPTVSGLLVYARVDGAFAVWDPARDYWLASDQQRAPAPLIFSREEVWNGVQESLGGRTTFRSNGLIADWIIWQNSEDRQPFETLKRVLGRLSPPELQFGDLGPLVPGKPTRIPRDSRWMPTIRHSYGEVPLVYASAGVKRIVALAYLIVWAWEEHQAQSKLIRKPPQKNMVILVDEIEAHLHPKWQRVIVPALLEVRQDLDPELRAQLLIATHSPLVTVSIEPYFDNTRDKIFHLDLVQHTLLEGDVVVEEHGFVKFGTVDSWLRSDVFELLQARSILAEKAVEDAKALQEQESAPRDAVAEVSERLVRYLPAHDPFWPRWTFFAAQHGVEV